MTPQDRKLRLTLGVLADGESLGRAVHALLGKRFRLQQLCVITLQRSLRQLVTAANGRGAELAPLLADSEALAGPAGIVLIGPTLMSLWRGGVRLPAVWGTNAERQSSPVLAEEIAKLVALGATILAVVPESDEQQWAATRILLAHSTLPVQTLEHSPAQGDSANI